MRKALHASEVHVAAALIALRGVTRIYGQGSTAFAALRGIDLTVRAGEFVAIMGPSGSGKSTAMNILGLLDTPSSGEYRFLGTPVHTLTRDERALLRRHYLGFVFQGFHLLPRTTALENVELPLIYRGVAARQRHAAARAALAEVGLAGWERHTPAELSGGQQQRVAIARAIVTQPRVLLADEPTGNLDSRRSHEIMTLIQRLNRERGLTVLMVTHEADIAAYAQRVVHFRDGRIECDGQSPDGQSPDGQSPDGQSPDGQSTGGQSTDGQGAGGESGSTEHSGGDGPRTPGPDAAAGAAPANPKGG